jgi:cytoplasmic iron level regulating protein YaaA (DUF328/UPF0246 family)
MIILISPAKSLDFENEAPTSKHSEIIFEDKAEYLAKKLKTFGTRKLKSMMDISDNLASLNVERYQAMSFPMGKAESKQAVFAFTGDVYQGLNPMEFSEDDLNFAQDHLRILSGLYGMLRPLDLIQPYRLEMGTDWKITQAKKNLYDFWKKTLTEQLKKEAKGSKFILNLASQEYAKAVDLKSIGLPVIAPEFKEEKGDKFQMISFFAKKARGMMTAYALKNRITEPEQLLNFDYEGYGYNERLSNREKNKWVFTRKSNK